MKSPRVDKEFSVGGEGKLTILVLFILYKT